MGEKELKLTINRSQAQELYDFIREHLDVINDTPFVETLMCDLETEFDLEGGN